MIRCNRRSLTLLYMFIWLCDCRQINLPMPRSQCRTATGTYFKCAGVTLTGLQARVRLFPSPQIKCCFSWLAVAQGLRVCECVCVFVGDGLREHFATLFDHCKYDFCLFLCHEPEWSLILRKPDTNLVSSREYEGVLNKAGDFRLFQEGRKKKGGR